MDCWFDNEHRNLRRQIRAWVKKHLGPGDHGQGNLEINACRLANQLGQDGFMAYAVPSRFGGVRETVQARDLCLIREELAWGSALADVMFGVQALGSYPIALAGSEEQQRRYLPPLAKGERIAAFALTEPNAGSDVSAISTQAERDTNGYRLNGVKHFISNAGIAHTYVVFASTQPEAKAKGLSAFIVESNSAGFTVKEKTPLLSPHPIGVVAFDDCFVPQHQRLGGEGEGLKIALRTLTRYAARWAPLPSGSRREPWTRQSAIAEIGASSDMRLRSSKGYSLRSPIWRRTLKLRVCWSTKLPR